MTSRTIPLILAATLWTGVTAVHGAAVLTIGNSNDTAYQTFVEGLGHTWTFKANGGSSEQIGGDLDATRVIGGTTQTLKAYIESFDYVIVLRGTSSSNFTQPLDWAQINKPVMVHNAFVARGSRFGLWDTDAGTFDTNFTDALEETTVLQASSSLFTNVDTGGGTANLYVDTQLAGDGVNIAGRSFAGGSTSVLGTFASAGVTYANLIRVAAGELAYNGNTLSSTAFSAERVFFSYRDAEGSFANLSSDGQDVVRNFLVPVPEPSVAAVLAGLGALAVVVRRRHSA